MWSIAALVALAVPTALGLLLGGPTLGGVPVLVWTGWGVVALNLVGFVVAWLLRTERFYDLVGSASFLAVVFSLIPFAARREAAWLVATLVTIWAVRLGTFLGVRGIRHGDRRLRALIDRGASAFGTAWMLQALWVWLTSLAAQLLIVRWNVPDEEWVPGLALWFLGLTIEVVADAQKARFRQEPANAGRWIDQGLWRWSRHPNYFGEILVWTGIWLLTWPVWTTGQPLDLLGVISPVFVFVLLTRVSGVPLLEKAAQERWGDDPAYRAYVARTRVLVPLPRW